MSKTLTLCMILLVVLLGMAFVSSRSTLDRVDSGVVLKPSPAAPAGINGSGPSGGPSSDAGVFQANGPYRVKLSEVQVGFVPDLHVVAPPADMPISDAEAELLRQKAMLMAPDNDIQVATSAPATLAPTLGVSFEALDAEDSNSSGVSTPRCWQISTRWA